MDTPSAMSYAELGAASEGIAYVRKESPDCGYVALEKECWGKISTSQPADQLAPALRAERALEVGDRNEDQGRDPKRCETADPVHYRGPWGQVEPRAPRG